MENFEKVQARIAELIQQHKDEFIEISHFVFEHPELGCEEQLSSAHQEEYLKGHGFSISHPLASCSTAFVAEYGAGRKPVIAFASEYDALPGYGPNGEPAHACGHNWIAASMCACGVVLSKLADELACSVRVVGCPAEENIGLKYDLCEAGVFDDIDLVLQDHLCDRTSLSVETLALNNVEYSYHGKAAHGASYPENGINALDAVVQLYNGLSVLRQQLRDDARIGIVIRNGGQAPNIIPELAVCEVEFRARDKKYLSDLRKKVEAVADGAALMTGTTLTRREAGNPYDDIIHVPKLMELGEECLRAVGITNIASPEENGKPGSSDIGNVSQVCPTLYAEFATEKQDPIYVHDVSALALVDTPVAHEKMLQVVEAFCLLAARLCLRPDEMAEVRREFEAAKG